MVIMICRIGNVPTINFEFNTSEMYNRHIIYEVN